MKTNINPLLLCLVLTLSLWHMNALSDSIVETLPGYPGPLPFKLRTGYVGVGESEEVQLFYYFIESQRSPKDDPLILWLTGGPGCSSLFGIVYENGPFTFDYANLIDGKPTLKSRPYSWTEVASIIFLDSPVGTGFSYAKTADAYAISDTEAAAQAAAFLRKWLMDYHPEFLSNPLYIGGDSYSGMVVPIVAQDIYDGNDVATYGPPLNIQGYILGNALTERIYDVNVRVRYAHRLALISDDLYKSLKENCNGNYVNVDPNNTACISDLQVYLECINDINPQQILEPNCDSLSPRPNLLRWDPNIFHQDPDQIIRLVPEPWCRAYNYLYSFMWANDRSVQEALHVRKGTKEEWVRCNTTLSEITFDYNVETTLPYHRNLTTKRCRALVYSGDHDTVVSYLATLNWINKLKRNLTVTGGWRPWFVDGQVAGYTEQYSGSSYVLTYATVKGAGHGAPEYKPKECFAMFTRWLKHFPV